MGRSRVDIVVCHHPVSFLFVSYRKIPVYNWPRKHLVIESIRLLIVKPAIGVILVTGGSFSAKHIPELPLSPLLRLTPHAVAFEEPITVILPACVGACNIWRSTPVRHLWERTPGPSEWRWGSPPGVVWMISFQE